MTLADYLAKNYLTADAKADKKSKKRKRKAGKADGLVIEDDDASGWTNSNKEAGGSDSDHDGPVTVAGARSAEFRKAQKSNWRTLSGAPVEPSSFSSSTAQRDSAGGSSSSTRRSKDKKANHDDDDTAAADAILASAAAETAARQAAEEDDAPAIDESGRQVMMENGAVAGLTSASALAAQLKKARMREKGNGEDDEGGNAAAQETIYRDASGRVVNIAMKRAEARAAAAAEERKRRQEVEDAKGDVQRRERERARQQLDDAKYLTVARSKDDVELNRELKERERWNDPAMQFMQTKEEKVSRDTGRPLYKGDFAPNRYSIRPGHRWDGVDRSNGFERDYFAAQNRRRNVANLEYAWQMDE